ncbi:MAG: PqqD family protein [Faecalibacterium sp.]
MSRRKDNFLGYCPVRSPANTWDVNDAGIVTVHLVHRGFYAAIAQKLFHRPRVSHIELDELGSFVFLQIDGQRTVEQIARQVREQFGETAEPLYERLIQYLSILRNNRFIYYQGIDPMPKDERSAP